MTEIGEIIWQIRKPQGVNTFQTVQLNFLYRTIGLPVDDARSRWVQGEASYNWDSSKTAAQIEKEIQNVCRAKIGVPPLP